MVNRGTLEEESNLWTHSARRIQLNICVPVGADVPGVLLLQAVDGAEERAHNSDRGLPAALLGLIRRLCSRHHCLR